jgi:PAS domain S-box-containing protein
MKIKKTFLLLFLFVVLFMSIIGLVVSALLKNQNSLLKSEEIKYQSYLIGDELRQSSDDLTNFCRLYVMTGDTTWEAKYWRVLQIRNGEYPRPNGRLISLQDSMQKLGFTEQELNLLHSSQKYSDDLVWTEKVAFNAIKGRFADSTGVFSISDKPDIKYAQKIMFDEKYLQDKENIMNPIDEFIVQIDTRNDNTLKAETNRGYILLIASILLITGTVVITILSYFLIKKKLNQQIKAELALQKSEDKFKAIYQNSNDAIMLLNRKGFFDCNQQTLTMFKINSKEEFTNFHPAQLSPTVQADGKNSFEAAQENIDIAYSEGYKRFDWIHCRTNGEEFFAEVHISAFNFGDEQVLQATVRDITERKLVEEALRHSNVFNESLIKTIPLGMDIVDETGTVLFQSDNLKRILGLDVIGEKCWDIYHDDKKQCSGCPLIKGITIGETNTYESYGILGNRVFEISHTGMMYQGKKALLEVIQDITERKENEQELIRAKERAEESDRLKSAFLTNMSHEIRTPMNGILGFAELLKEPNLTVEEQQEFIRTIGEGGARMLNTINDIIDFSKLESGLVNVDIKETNVNEQIEFIYKFFKPEVESKGLEFHYKEGLQSKDAIIRTDNEKVYGILTNFVKNAIKFTNEGSIEFGYEKKGGYLEFFVKDTGIGIPKKNMEIIFERFRQGSESFDRAYEGCGLGLSICKSYVKMLYGNIWVESEERKGSTFYFTIPCNSELEEKNSIENVVSAEDKEVPLNKLKILVAEDDEISYSLMRRLLLKISNEVLHAKTGLEAVVVCHNNPDIDLVLMDVKMPDMDGHEATRQIRQFNTDVIIITQTAYVLSDDREKAIEAGCNDYITKPINKTLLFELIKKHYKG